MPVFNHKLSSPDGVMVTASLQALQPYPMHSPWKILYIFLKWDFQKAQSKVLVSVDMPVDLIWYCDFTITNVFFFSVSQAFFSR